MRGSKKKKGNQANAAMAQNTQDWQAHRNSKTFYSNSISVKA